MIEFNIESNLDKIESYSIVDTYIYDNVLITCIIDNKYNLNYFSEINSLNSDQVLKVINDLNENKESILNFNYGYSYIGIIQNNIIFSLLNHKEGIYSNMNFKFALNNDIKIKLIQIFNKLIDYINKFNTLKDINFFSENESEDNPESDYNPDNNSENYQDNSENEANNDC